MLEEDGINIDTEKALNNIRDDVSESGASAISRLSTPRVGPKVDLNWAEAGRKAPPIPEEDFPPYDFRATVGTAQYMSPIVPGIPLTRSSPGKGDAMRPELMTKASKMERRDSKTELWRERGPDRWPAMASNQKKKQPHQFVKAEEVVPLRRTVNNQQTTIFGELWCRSLREKKLEVDTIGQNHQDMANVGMSCLFDRRGHGYTGRTNQLGGVKPVRGKYGPHVNEWVERPVAVGKLAEEHMGGTRYKLDVSPRPCVPASMAFTTPAGQAAGSPRIRENAPSSRPHAPRAKAAFPWVDMPLSAR